jgi:hypothetical protein|tara:strand:- start:2422 stop:4341 length:1920 start_codon:yes stop_codon:yes gene_type:complete
LRILAVAAVAGLPAWTLGFEVRAQQDQPILLTPPQKLAPPPGASSPPTQAPTPPAIPPGEPVAATQRPSGVKIDSLQSIDSDATGTLTASRGGFGADMWLGTERDMVEKLLPQLPVSASSAAMRDLMRRLLLSTARVPEGKAQGVSLLAIRAKLLAAMGDLVSLNTLLNATPGRSRDQELVRVETEARFLSNDNARACALAGGQIRDHKVPYWQKAFLFCQALAGEHGKASLGVSVMRESGEKDEVFFALIESLGTGTPAILDSLSDPTPLHLAMARVAKAKLPDNVILSNRPGVLRTIAISPNAPVGLRLEAAERAESAGALPVDSLRQIYSGVSFSEQDLANPLSRAETEGGPMTRALLYHTSLIQTVPTAQAEVVARALALGREEGRYESVVRVFMPVLKRIPPSAELVWFAPEAVRALLLRGDTLAAEAWFALMRAGGLFNKDTAKAIDQLMPIVRLMGSSEAAEWNTAKLSAWWETVKGRPNPGDDAALLYSIFDALGQPVPADSWRKLVTGANRRMVTMPNPALWFRLLEATETAGRPEPERKTAKSDETAFNAAAGAFEVQDPETGDSGDARPRVRRRVAETVLLSLLALGEAGPAGADPLLLRQVLISLRHTGFEKEARAMAVEAALAAGL